MKKTLLMLLLAAIALISYATEFAPAEEFAVYSSDGEYKLRVVPPRFENTTSYQFFQKEDFLTVRTLEGVKSLDDARIKLILYKKNREEQYYLVWERTTPSTIIPTHGQILEGGPDRVIVLEGKYGEIEPENVPYSVFKMSGACVTNNTYKIDTNGAANAKWEFDRRWLQLRKTSGEIVTSLQL